MHWYASNDRLWFLALKTIVTFVALYGFMELILIPTFEFAVGYTSENMDFSVFGWHVVAINVLVFAIFIPFYFFMIVFFIAYGALLLLLNLWLVLYGACFVLLRVVEHDRGPVLGLAGLLVGFGAIAKYL